MTSELIKLNRGEKILANGLFGSSGFSGEAERLCEMDESRFAQLYADSENRRATSIETRHAEPLCID